MATPIFCTLYENGLTAMRIETENDLKDVAIWYAGRIDENKVSFKNNGEGVDIYLNDYLVIYPDGKKERIRAQDFDNLFRRMS